ncbi:hypothetical protein NLI96_g13238 [Meripilus lineatus]|uniref:Uncharacterized protein n=1 Tax=Meripilus lineatus TaxID=2056292 RepID=A0AAD5YBN9_9APHY|nr:hypothetical protein NLI96_g13238 [Physisporinus lineatus]
MTALRDRLIWIIDHLVTDRGRYSKLEALTDIPASKWKMMYTGNTKPSAEMLPAILRLAPEYTFWALHGEVKESDKETVQYDPATEQLERAKTRAKEKLIDRDPAFLRQPHGQQQAKIAELAKELLESGSNNAWHDFTETYRVALDQELDKKNAENQKTAARTQTAKRPPKQLPKR